MANKIIDGNGKEISEASAIKAYFGTKQGQSLQEFMAELKALTLEDKTELAVGAARELGYHVV